MEQARQTNPAKEFLRSYRAILHRQNSLIRALANLRDRQTNCTVKLRAVQVQTGGWASDRMAEEVVKAIDLEDQILDAERQASLALAEIMRAIGDVQDETQRTVLTLRYIEGLDWLSVADRIGYEISNTYILHGRALLEVNKWLEVHKDCTKM